MPPLILSDKAHITQGDLPHWDDKKAIYFATFRLADSLPITAMKEFRAWEEDKLESLNHGNVTTTAWEEFDVKLLIFNEIRKYLHLYLRPTSGLFSAASSPRRHLLDKARCLVKQIQNTPPSYHCIAKLGHRAPT